MSFIQNLNQYVGVFTFLGGVALAWVGIVVYKRKGGNLASDAAIKTYQDAVAAYDTRLKQVIQENTQLQQDITTLKERHNIEIAQLHQDIERVRTMMTEQQKKFDSILFEKDKQITLTRDILEGRNKENVELVKQATDFMKTNNERLTIMSGQVGAVYDKLIGSGDA